MITHATRLAAKVAAQNEVNEIGNVSFPDAIKALEPLVGQKICKADGTLLKKVKEALPVFQRQGVQFWYSTGMGYSLVLNIKTCHFVEPMGCAYAENSLYLGGINNGVLTELHKKPDYKTDYTEEFVRAARLEVREAEKAKSAAESKIHPFGMYD